MSCYKITVSYCGREFNGWQKLTGSTARTVQGTIEYALSQYLGEEIAVTGSGRTDAGVSARAQVCSFHFEGDLSNEDLHGINWLLPKAVSVTGIERADDRFNARIHARSKVYRYSLWTGDINPGMYSDEVFCIGRLDEEEMNRQMQKYVGKWDFNAFASQSKNKNTVKRIDSVRLERDPRDANILHIYIAGGGFLYNMVRNMVGVAIACVRGSLSEKAIDAALRDRDANVKGHKVPANALCLWQVGY